MDYLNVNLNSNYETSQAILDSYSFDCLLLEVSCNLRDHQLTKEGIKKQFEESLNSKIQSAKDVFNANIDNIVKKAKHDREN